MRKLTFTILVFMFISSNSLHACNNPSFNSCQTEAENWVFDSCLEPCGDAFSWCDSHANTEQEMLQCWAQSSRCEDNCWSDFSADICNCTVVYCPGPHSCQEW